MLRGYLSIEIVLLMCCSKVEESPVRWGGNALAF